MTILCCPTCGGALDRAAPAAHDVDGLTCRGCGTRWPVRFGIPDLREPPASDPYLSRAEDLEAAEHLFREGERAGFEAALAAYYASNERVPPAQARRFIAGTLAAPGRSAAMLATWRAWADDAGPTDDRVLVDLGCGTGPLTTTAAQQGFRSVGIDIGLRWLVLAALRAREAGVPLTLICASADKLPLVSRGADIVAGESILENVASPAGTVREAARVLPAGGHLWLTTPNRWSLGPDPHLGLPLGGWLPERLVAAYARRRGMVAPRRLLVSAGALHRLLVAHGFGPPRIGPPPIATSQRAAGSSVTRLAVDAYEAVRRLPAGAAFLRALGPILLAVTRRGGAPHA